MDRDERAAAEQGPAGTQLVQFENGAQRFLRSLPSRPDTGDAEPLGSQSCIRTIDGAQQQNLWKPTTPTLKARRQEPTRVRCRLSSSRQVGYSRQ